MHAWDAMNACMACIPGMPCRLVISLTTSQKYTFGGGLDCLLIFLIMLMAADVVMSPAGAMPSGVWQEA